MNFYPRHIGDYSRDASHLSILEHGVYTLLLDRYYATEKPIPANETYRIVRATTRQEKAAVDSVLREFFSLTDDGWQHKRVEEEIAKMLEKSKKAADSAKRRWDANAMRTHSDGNAKAMLSNNQYPITNNQTESLQPFSNTSRGGRKGLTSVSEILGKGLRDGR